MWCHYILELFSMTYWWVTFSFYICIEIELFPFGSLSVSLSWFCHDLHQAYISAKNKDNDKTFSGHDPSGLKGLFMTSWMTLSSIFQFEKPKRLPCIPLLDPHFWHTSNEDINTKLRGYLSWGKIRSSMTSEKTMSSKLPVMNSQHPSKLQEGSPFLTQF